MNNGRFCEEWFVVFIDEIDINIIIKYFKLRKMYICRLCMFIIFYFYGRRMSKGGEGES